MIPVARGSEASQRRWFSEEGEGLIDRHGIAWPDGFDTSPDGQRRRRSRAQSRMPRPDGEEHTRGNSSGLILKGVPPFQSHVLKRNYSESWAVEFYKPRRAGWEL